MNWWELFHYDEVSGKLFSNDTGEEVGTLSSKGNTIYLQFYIDKVCYLVHRVVWEMHNGAIPSGMVIDHDDRNGLNNRLENLNLKTIQSNAKNSRLSKRNTTGFNGVYLDRRVNKYYAQGVINGKSKTLASGFNTPEEAYEILLAWMRANGYSENHGKKEI